MASPARWALSAEEDMLVVESGGDVRDLSWRMLTRSERWYEKKMLILTALSSVHPLDRLDAGVVVTSIGELDLVDPSLIRRVVSTCSGELACRH